MATNKGTRKRVPPSRERYEETHPVISVRVTPEMRERLEQLKSESGMSTADIIRIGMNKARPYVKAANIKLLENTFEEAREYFEVEYPCPRCGYWHQAIVTEESKAIAAEFMYEQGRMDFECRLEFDEAT